MRGRKKGSKKIPGSGKKVEIEEDRAISRTITLKKKHWKKLRKISEDRKITVNKVVSNIIKMYLEE